MSFDGSFDEGSGRERLLTAAGRMQASWPGVRVACGVETFAS